jgi:energy-coupling factor transporter ATP-binding protein EcfA2
MFREKVSKMKDHRMEEGQISVGYSTGYLNFDFINGTIVYAKKDNMKLKYYSVGITDGSMVMVIGRAGCGKTTIENSMKLLLESDTVCLGSTGLAALLNGGMTSHKALSMPFGIPLEEDYNAFWSTASKTTKALFGPKSPVTRIFFDEVGMTTSYQMHWMDFALKKLYRTDKPFGGLQVCLFGDVSQLEPVVKSQERPFIMNSFGGVNFFESSAFIDGNFKIYNLKEVKRQDNQEMIKHLNNIRVYGYNFNLKEYSYNAFSHT